MNSPNEVMSTEPSPEITPADFNATNREQFKASKQKNPPFVKI
ncbi:MAG: hypothetical protein ACK521_04560 [bacterium]